MEHFLLQSTLRLPKCVHILAITYCVVLRYLCSV